jgi:hypothetical protein
VDRVRLGRCGPRIECGPAGGAGDSSADRRVRSSPRGSRPCAPSTTTDQANRSHPFRSCGRTGGARPTGARDGPVEAARRRRTGGGCPAGTDRWRPPGGDGPAGADRRRRDGRRDRADRRGRAGRRSREIRARSRPVAARDDGERGSRDDGERRSPEPGAEGGAPARPAGWARGRTQPHAARRACGGHPAPTREQRDDEPPPAGAASGGSRRCAGGASASAAASRGRPSRCRAAGGGRSSSAGRNSSRASGRSSRGGGRSRRAP